MFKGEWNDELTTELKGLWAAGKSAGVIAREISRSAGTCITRNAVIGKVHRLKLDGRRTIEARDGHERPPVPADRKRRRPRPKLKVWKPMPKVEPPPQLTEQPPTNPPVLLFDLEKRHCRWVIGDPSAMLFCGADRAEPSSYCAFHMKQSRVRS